MTAVTDIRTFPVARIVAAELPGTLMGLWDHHQIRRWIHGGRRPSLVRAAS